MDLSDSINNRTVKFVVSCCVVSKQVEVSTIIESTGSWLHAGTCSVAQYPSNSPILLHINQPVYIMERNMEYTVGVRQIRPSSHISPPPAFLAQSLAEVFLSHA